MSAPDIRKKKEEQLIQIKVSMLAIIENIALYCNSKISTSAPNYTIACKASRFHLQFFTLIGTLNNTQTLEESLKFYLYFTIKKKRLCLLLSIS